MGSAPNHELENEVESGYVSGSSSEASIPEIYFTKPHLAFLNRQLQNLEPQGWLSLVAARRLCLCV